MASPVIGFAADGFPVHGPYVNDHGTIRKVKSSYQPKSGNRPADSCPVKQLKITYSGEYNDDYEYVAGSGDLDECNGTCFDGHYAYYVTEEYPHIMKCFKGTPDSSFAK